ncbi:hypothetical protein K3495_g12002, partial [Podosphaera aphanis]
MSITTALTNQFSNNSTTMNNTTWGAVPIFNGTNYHQFETCLKDVLEIAGGWTIVAGTEKKPIELTGPDGKILNSQLINDWTSRNERAIIIIAASVSSVLRSESFRAATTSRDAAALWTEAQKLKSNSGGIFTASVRSKFHSSYFDPRKMTINQYYEELASAQKRLLGTEQPIVESEILQRILLSLQNLPKDNHHWHSARFHIAFNNLSLSAALQVLVEAEAMESDSTNLIQSANFANNNPGNSNNAPSNRGSRGRGGYRGRGRGGIHKSNSNPKGGHRGRASTASRNPRGRGNNHSINNGNNGNGNVNNNHNGKRFVGRDNCGFCLQPGHWRRDCVAYARAQNLQLGSGTRNSGNNSANVATDTSQLNFYDYIYPNQYVNVVMETALLSVYRSKSSWKVDSGATRHFSGRLSDFSGL